MLSLLNENCFKRALWRIIIKHTLPCRFYGCFFFSKMKTSDYVENKLTEWQGMFEIPAGPCSLLRNSAQYWNIQMTCYCCIQWRFVSQLPAVFAVNWSIDRLYQSAGPLRVKYYTTTDTWEIGREFTQPRSCPRSNAFSKLLRLIYGRLSGTVPCVQSSFIYFYSSFATFWCIFEGFKWIFLFEKKFALVDGSEDRWFTGLNGTSYMPGITLLISRS